MQKLTVFVFLTMACAMTCASQSRAQDANKADAVPDSAVAAAEEQAKAANADEDQTKKDEALGAEDLTKATDKAAALRATADAAVKEAETAESEQKRINGIIEKRGFWWNKRLNVGLTGSMLFSDSFVGQTDGWTAQVGFLADGAINLGWKGIEVRNTGKLQESFISTPAIGSWSFENFSPVFLKAADLAEWESLALYTLPGFPYVGPYGRVKASTQVFTGYTYFTDDTTVRYKGTNGQLGLSCGADTSDTCVDVTGGSNADRVGLTGFLEPLILEEAVGAIILPPSFPPWVEYKFQAGIGARHIITRDFFFGALGPSGYVVNDDAATPQVDLTQLTSVHSAGPEAEAQINGAIYDRVTWGVKAGVYYAGVATGAQGVFVPALDSESTIKQYKAGPLEFENQVLGPLSFNFESLVTLKLLDWLSINWQNRVRREPFVITAVQIQSQLLLTVGYSVF